MFYGGVAGGNGTLELASAASAGTLTATGFTGFNAVDFDTGSQWTIAGSTTALVGTIAGFTIGDAIDLTGFAAVSATYASGALTLTNSATAHTTLHFSGGSLTTSNFQLGGGSTTSTYITFVTPASALIYGQTIDKAGIVASSETVTAGTMTLKNAGGTSVGTLTVGTSLSTGDFALKTDGSGGTDVIVTSVFGTYASGVTLLTNPTTITATGKVSNAAASGVAVSGPTGTAWTVTNLGSVAESGATTPIGISLAASGTVINSGSVSATTAASNGVGVSLAAGGVVTNQSGGAISGPFGVQAASASATVVNAGTISGTSTAVARAGVKLSAGGSVTNQSGGTISGFYGVWGQTDAISVVNQGVLTGALGTSLGVGVYLAAGGSLTNAAAASISGGNAVYVRGAAATVQNAGIITGNATNASNAGVYLKVAGSSLTNQSGGTITGFRGVADIGATVVNAGSVGGNTSAATGAGVLLNTGGALTNQSGGTITGFLGVYNSSGAVTVVNAGDIAGNLSTGKGISLKAAGTVTNQSGGTISGGAGAVQFAAGVTNLLVAGPGAVFTGTVTGGNTIGAASISTLELASGASAGTLTGLGSQFIDFAHIAIDAGASWTVSGTNALAQGITLTDSGTLTNSGTFTNAALITGAADGLILAASAPLTNQTGGTISGSTAGVVANAAGSVANAGIITGTGFGVELASGGTVTAQSGGTISSAGTAVSFGASHTNRLVIYQGASFTGQVDGGNTIGAASISTLELASSASAGTLSGLGTQFVNFAQITVDTGAQWTLSGTQTGFATLTNAGSLGGAASFGIQVGTSATGVTVVNSSGGAITGSTDAIYVVTGSGAGTVSNSGRITGGTTGFAAINLSGGGSVSNATGGTISGHQAGVFIAQGTGATVSNAGSIGASQAYGIWLENNGTVTNQSAGIITGGYLTTNAAGVYLGHGGAVTNQSGGTIGGLRGVYAQSAAATVVNAGHLVGGTTTIGTGASATGEGVYLGAGGTVTNQLGGTITGYLGVEGHTAITVLNAGSIGGNATGSGAVGVYLGAGGSVTNQSGGTITGYYGVRATTAAANVVNAGVIAGNYTSNYNNADGVYLGAGGSVTNQAGGAIFGRNDGVLISGAAGTVLNLGSIHSHIGGYGGRGVSLDAGGVITNGASGGTASTAFISGYNYAVQFGASGTDTLINYGTISGLPGTVAVSMATGTIINGTSGATGALIQGGAQNNAVLIGGAATVLNYATITGSEYYGDTAVFFGISLAGNGSVASTIGNLGSSALITNYVAVYAARNATVTNAGTLSAAMVHGGTAHNALIFGGGTNRLIVDPGAVFIGGVNGGGAVTLTPTIGSPTVLGTANGIGTTTLELASAASAGTLAGFGTTIDNFASLVFDSGARWTVKGNASAAGLGTLGIGGFTFGDTIDLTGFVAASRTFTGSALVLTNAGGAHQTLAIASTLATGNFAISSYGTGGTGITLQPLLAYAETLDQAGILATTETVTAGTMTLKNGGGTVVGTLVVGTSLSSGDFSLATDGAGGTNVVVHTATGTYTNGVTLSVNPSTIGSVATISGTSASAAGVSGPSGTAWTLTNLGHISETGTNSAGVSFAAAGTITNAASGSISGAQSGIALAAGGSVTNLAGGTIAGLTGIRGVGAAVTVVNTGSIGGTVVTATSAGITLSAGGAITNQTSGAITGYVGIEASGTAITMVNAGSVGGNTAGGEGVLINAGGTVTNTAGATLSGHDGIRGGAVGLSTIVNAGVIKGVTNSGGHGIILNDSGYVSNQSGGTIIGYQAVLGRGTPLTVINAGSIGGNTTSGTGVTASAGGTITNAAGGRITGYLAVLVYAGGTVLNAGVIAGGTGGGQGINLPSGGTVTAQAGTISGGADAVLFAAGYTGRLLFNPGAVFTGTVDGGNTIGATSVSTLELTSAAGAGTLSGLGTKYIHFVRTTIDAGANWTLSGANTLVAGATLTNSGTLTDTGTLVTGGTLTGNRARLSGGTLTNLSGGLVTAAYLYGASAGGADTVVNLGHITGGSNLAIYLAAGGAVSNAAGGSVSGGGAAVKIKGTAASVLNLGQIASTATDATGYGVYLRDGGVITNGQSGAGTSTAAITGYYGLSFKTADVVNAQGTLVNYGTVRGSGTASSAVLLSNAGNVFNGQSGAAAALIEGGRYGVSSGAGTVVNDASIIATGTAAGDYGIAIPGAGNVSNLGSAALIEGYGGVLIGLNGTITNGGTIESNQGAGGVAIRFTGGNARLIDEPGAVFTGSLYGGSGGTAVLELGSAATAGTISGFGTTVTNFTSLVFDTGARWTVKGNNSANGLGTIGIAGFTFGDTIDLTGIAATGESFGGNVLTLTAGGTTQATLHIAGAFSTDEFLIASDGSTGTDITLVTPPTVVAGGTVGFTGGGAAVTLNGALSLIDTAATLLASGTVVIGGGFLAGDTLNFINQNNIAGNFNTATGTLTLSGVASLADYQAALDSITYGFNPSFGDPTGGGSDLARTIDWMVNDGSVASNIGTSTVTVTHVPPVLTAGGSVTFDGGGAAVTLDGSLSLSDTDSGGVLNSGTVSIVGFVVGDILSANTTGLAISTAYNPATGVLTLSGIDTLADYQAVLRSVSYSVDPADTDPTNGGAATTRTIDWSINDGATISNPGTSVLNLVHTAPAITAGGTVSFTGGGGPVVLDSGIIVTDVDSGGELTGATIAVGGGFISGDTLKFVTQNGITGGFNGATGVLTLSGTATIAEYETALASVTYSFSPRTVIRPMAARISAAASTGRSRMASRSATLAPARSMRCTRRRHSPPAGRSASPAAARRWCWTARSS